MIGIIVLGHDEFASGLTSAVELIAGKQDHYLTLKFTKDITPGQLGEDLTEAIKSLQNDKGILIFTDLKGGTPFKEAMEISIQYPNVRVLTGTNIAMLLEAALMRVVVNDVNTFAKSLVQTGIDQIGLFDINELNKFEDS